KIAIGVVEGNHHCATRESVTVRQHCDKLAGVDRLIEAGQVAELAVECGRASRHQIGLELRVDSVWISYTVVQQSAKKTAASQHCLVSTVSICARGVLHVPSIPRT